jgi:hypothetical protein
MLLSEISKKIAVMNEEMQGFWANNSWDIRKCPHPSAISILFLTTDF